jgi:hypothetical protein
MQHAYTSGAAASRLAECGQSRIIGLMDRPTATSQIRTICNDLSAGITRIHPLLPALDDEPTKGEIIKALFELTKNVEVVKKQLMKLERRDDSSLT